MSFESIVDIIGILIGLYAIFLLYRHKLGGKVGSAVNYFVWGVIFQILAFGWTLSTSVARLDLFSDPVKAVGGPDVHHFLMAIGMAFFVWSAVKFTSLLRVSPANSSAQNSK